MNEAYTIAAQRADAADALWSDGHGLEALAMARDAYESATLAAGHALGERDPGERAARFLALGVPEEDVRKAERAYAQNTLAFGAASADLLRVVRASAGPRSRIGLVMVFALLLCALALVGGAFAGQTGAPWSIRFYPSADFRGPELSEHVHGLRYRWGALAPRRELPADNFSLRADVCLHVETPTVLHLRVASDDRIRVFFDQAQVLGSWQEQPFSEHAHRLALEEGAHELRVEYSDAAGEAQLEVDLALSEGSLEGALMPRSAEGCGELATSTLLEGRRRHPSLTPFLRSFTQDAGALP